jgi:hypothetical protein
LPKDRLDGLTEMIGLALPPPVGLAASARPPIVKVLASRASAANLPTDRINPDTLVFMAAPYFTCSR